MILLARPNKFAENIHLIKICANAVGKCKLRGGFAGGNQRAAIEKL